ncbi:hypothetical protein HMN09_01311100 [Mycena chlorophos]|uniref:F-box domain-containing protein n=1 Tax=Mycena chlorophos TaxID=658473 RepID=A0A8H6RYF5_MYCCL|nr:hypothetical protein HMN09_01311100 [Mycena chlorophos]
MQPNTAPRLPLELLLMICIDAADSLTLETLAVLCRTWRAFLAPAQRLMYRDVDLEAKPMSAVRSWALAVTCHPHLAERVQSLAIELPDELELLAEDQRQVRNALAACVHITKLRFLRIGSGNGCNGIDFVLRFCTFRLTHFTTSYFDFASLSFKSFLAKQNQLRFLVVLPGARIDWWDLEEEPRPALPSLIGFKGNADIPAGRQFQRLELSWAGNISDLQPYAQTLTTLNLILDAPQNIITILIGLHALSRKMPSIHHLGLMSSVKAGWLESLQALLGRTGTMLQPFTQLETLAIIDHRTGAADEEELCGVAKTLMEKFSSLRRVAIAAKVAEEREKMCIATRDADSEIQTVIEDKIDFEAAPKLFSLCSVKTEMAQQGHLPPELLFMICNEASSSRRTLAVLCRTSITFQTAAERILYRTVDLTGRQRPLHAALSWSLALLNHPHLAESVRSLSIQLPGFRSLLPKDMDTITAGLVACVNLKVLHFLREDGRDASPSTDWVLHKCRFQLTEFASSYFTASDAKFFLGKQTELRFLSVSDAGDLSLDAERWVKRPPLPNLMGIKAPAEFFTTALDRPLQRIETNLYIYRLPLRLQAFSHTLTTLNLLDDPTIDPRSLSGRHAEALKQVSKYLLALLHLAIVDLKGPRYSAGPALERLPRTQAFSRLETLTLIWRRVVHFSPDEDIGFIGASRSEDGTRDVAERCMAGCSSLWRVVIGYEFKDHSEMMYTSTRDSSGGILTTVDEEINFEAVSMFWV